jgi:hypothetical protein
MVNQFRSPKFESLVQFDGTNILTFYSIDDGLNGNIAFSIGMLVALMFIFAGLGVLAIAKVQHGRR